jgi:hypothetical protein
LQFGQVLFNVDCGKDSSGAIVHVAQELHSPSGKHDKPAFIRNDFADRALHFVHLSLHDHDETLEQLEIALLLLAFLLFGVELDSYC